MEKNEDIKIFKSELINSVANQIKQDIISSQSTYIGTSKELAQTYNVGRNTILKSLRLLRDQNLLTFRKGQRIAINRDQGEKSSQIKSELNPIEKISNIIKNEILQGKYSIKTRLPKISFLASQYKVSTKTICNSFSLLQNEGFVHRKGKFWFAGPVVSLTVKSKERKVIIIIQTALDTWRVLQSSPSFTNFVNRFDIEALQYQVELINALTEYKGMTHLQGLIPCGFDEITQLYNQVKDRFLGFLVLSTPNECKDLENWLHWLLEFKKPVVILDRNWGRMQRKKRVSNLYCMSGNLRRGVSCILDTLHKWKHSHIALASYKSTKWMEYLYQLYKEESQKLSPSLQISFIQEDELFWQRQNESPLQIIERLRKQGIPMVKRVIEAAYNDFPYFVNNPQIQHPMSESPHHIIHPSVDNLIWPLPVLSHILKTPTVTSLIMPNAELSVSAYFCLRALKISLPLQFSLISSEQTPVLQPFPISSIDQGFDTLGYQAFHLFIGDMKLHPDPYGNFIATPLFIDRGSAGLSNQNSSIKIDFHGDLR